MGHGPVRMGDDTFGSRKRSGVEKGWPMQGMESMRGR